MANDGVGGEFNGVTALTNGNYVVSSPGWTNGAAASAGAVTWGSGTAGVTVPSVPRTAWSALLRMTRSAAATTAA